MSEFVDAAQPRYDFVANLIAADFPPPAKLIKLGTAPGHQIAQLASRGYEAVSIDLGAAEDDWGSGGPGRFRGLLAETGVTHLEWDLEKVPYPLDDASFDVAVMTEVLEHLREYPSRSLSEILRILHPGGRLYLTTPNAAYLVNRLKLLVGGSVHTRLEDWIGGLPHARHAREYTFGEIRVLLEHVGFRMVSEQSCHFYLGSGRTTVASMAVKHVLAVLARLRKSFGPSIIVVAERP